MGPTYERVQVGGLLGTGWGPTRRRKTGPPLLAPLLPARPHSLGAATGLICPKSWRHTYFWATPAGLTKTAEGGVPICLCFTQCLRGHGQPMVGDQVGGAREVVCRIGESLEMRDVVWGHWGLLGR